MNRTLVALTLGLALAGAPATLQAGGPEETPAARAAKLYRDATRLYEVGELASAEPLFRKAWALHHSYDIASNLGALELELGKPRAAAELLSYALSQFPARGSTPQRAALEARFDEARKLVGVLRLRVSVAGAELAVDGEPIGRSPLTSAVFVTPGERVVSAKLAGYTDAQITVRVPKGSAFDVTLPLQPQVVAKRSLVPVVAGGATFAVAAATGAALFVASQGQRSKANSLHDAIVAAGGTCATPSPQCDDLHAATSATDMLNRGSIAAFVVAGAAVAGTVTYLLWPRFKPADKKVDVRAALGPSGGGAVLAGSF